MQANYRVRGGRWFVGCSGDLSDDGGDLVVPFFYSQHYLDLFDLGKIFPDGNMIPHKSRMQKGSISVRTKDNERSKQPARVELWRSIPAISRSSGFWRSRRIEDSPCPPATVTFNRSGLLCGLSSRLAIRIA